MAIVESLYGTNEPDVETEKLVSKDCVPNNDMDGLGCKDSLEPRELCEFVKSSTSVCNPSESRSAASIFC